MENDSKTISLINYFPVEPPFCCINSNLVDLILWHQISKSSINSSANTKNKNNKPKEKKKKSPKSNQYQCTCAWAWAFSNWLHFHLYICFDSIFLLHTPFTIHPIPPCGVLHSRTGRVSRFSS